MTRATAFILTIFFGLFAFAGPAVSPAHACTAEDFGAVVDETAQALRELNASGAERFREKLRTYQKKYDLSDTEVQQRAAAIQDDRMSDFNREIETLVTQMDTLSQMPSENITCENLEEMKRVRDRLLTVMGQKSGYMLAKADAELDRPAGSPPSSETRAANAGSADEAAADPVEQSEAAVPAAAETETAEAPSSAPSDPAPDETARAEDEARPIETPGDAPAEKTAKAAPLEPGLPERRTAETAPVAGDWTTDSQVILRDTPGEQQTALADDSATPPPTSLAPSGEQTPDGALDDLPSTLPDAPVETHYTISEIQDAGRGLFGPITAQLAAAINYAFQQFGRPNAFIAGSEGSAAFLAGLRYGKGMLNTKSGGQRVVYWQGPSLGYDLGAEGSDTLFLVYNLDTVERVYGRFTGIGGSAYVAGGVGLNVLGKGDMVMVPIRTGIGLRLGANLAYLKFTERQTWNPF